MSATPFSGYSQIVSAAVAALLASQGRPKFAGKRSEKQSPVAGPASSSKPIKKSSLTAVSENPPCSSSSSSSIVSFSSLLSVFVLWARSSSSREVAGDEQVGLAGEALLESLAGMVCGVTVFCRVLPASEFRWVGAGWLCSAV